MDVSTTPSLRDSTPPFGKLSIDLVLQIADLLPSESVLALALTTKTLFNSHALWRIWGPQVRNSPGHHAQSIARYSPDWLYCGLCQRLHPRRDTPKITDDWRDLQACPLRPEQPIWLHFDTWDYHVQFEDVYKVMTRHRWGAPYGEALESLAVITEWQALRYNADEEDGNSYLASRGRCLTKLVVTPEIVEHQLVLHTIQRLWLPRDVWTNRSGRFAYTLIACQHARKPTSGDQTFWPPPRRRPLLYLWWEQKASDKVTKLPPYTSGCCSTAFFEANWDHQDAGVEMAMFTTTELGCCDYPLSAKWKMAASRVPASSWPFFRRSRVDVPVPVTAARTVERYHRITNNDGEVGSASFETAKGNIAVRNRVLDGIKLCSENADATAAQDDPSDQKVSRKKRFSIKILATKLWNRIRRRSNSNKTDQQ